MKARSSECDKSVTPSPAFKSEEGQFVCHLFTDITEPNSLVLDELIEIVLQNSIREALWSRLSSIGRPHGSQLHLTLLRGHRAIYYHHIKPLVKELKIICGEHKPLQVFLSDLRIFHNHEKTKEFLCLATNPSSESSLASLKQQLKKKIDHYAIKLTDEDETEDTLTHCSIASRNLKQTPDHSNNEHYLSQLAKLCTEKLGDIPLLAVKIECIRLIIGCVTYELPLEK